jgi:mono/diheme cytochrome c family protein
VLEEKAPSLRYAGSKFNHAFLINWLQEPVPIRPLKYNSLTEKNPADHKKLTPKEAANVVKYLMTLRFKDMEQLKIKPKETILAKKIFSVRYSCYACHQVKGEGSSGVTGGLSGPSLVNAGTRLNPDWIYAFLSSPRDLLARGSMPVYEGIIKDDDLKELTKYIATFK